MALHTTRDGVKRWAVGATAGLQHMHISRGSLRERAFATFNARSSSDSTQTIVDHVFARLHQISVSIGDDILTVTFDYAPNCFCHQLLDPGIGGVHATGRGAKGVHILNST